MRHVMVSNHSWSVLRNFHTRAASTPPTSGARMKTQTEERAVPPTKSAGPKERAGFTEVPVKWMPRICTSVRVSPITSPETEESFSLEVTPRIEKTKTKVRTISMIREAPMLLL